MQFNFSLVVAALAGLAIASPTVEVRDTATDATGLAVSVNGVTFSQDVSISCVLHCAEVIAEAVCIGLAIEEKSVKGLLKCVEKGKICACAECVPKLKDFVKDHDICS
ncbi:hypothetical protein G7Y89_g7724 [Cudoniella acicularis]|uniref:Fungal calcium binding protein domain-containing protein n=1 Tax=Cudoniella acicularis TaxID=354080 RepID=A0A8H4W1P5_9HELO|nr:hypothetical protein G7Y89_g7724 [Cudoniella acicularis]